MRLGDYSAHVIVGGKELEEYDVVHESPTKVTCWIASEEGKNFIVKWKCHKETRSTAVSGGLKIDGICCGSQFLRPGNSGQGDTIVRSSVHSDTASRDFIFSRVQLTDDDSLLDKEVHKELGNICLNVEHGNLVKIHPKSRQDIHALGVDDKFHERSKKATVHCVNFGPERTQQRKPITWRVVPNGDPKLNLVFKYRPLAILQANGIAPRPTPPDRGMNINEPLEVKDKIRKLEEELKRLRDIECSTSEDRKPKRVKKEDSEPRKRALFTPGEIIDLT